MKRSRGWWVLGALGLLSACAAERGPEAEPVRFAQSSGDQRAAPSEVAAPPTASAPPRSERGEGADVDDVIAMDAAAPGRADRLFELAVRWEERSESDTIGDLAATARARAIALRAYGALIDGYPRYPALDEALFRAAQTHQLSNNMELARRRYLLLIQRFPTSRFVAPAYLSFAEFFFAQQDWSSARQFYTQVTNLAGADPALVAFARYRVARTQFGEGDCRAAAASLGALLRAAGLDPAVQSAAQRDLSLLGACRPAPSSLPDAVAVQPPRPRLSSSDEIAQRSGSPMGASAP